AIWRMLEQPRFRAAVDFLQLRAEAREVDSVMAQWWMDLANADPDERVPTIEAYQASPRDRAPAVRKRRRRPRRKPAGNAGPAGGTAVACSLSRLPHRPTHRLLRGQSAGRRPPTSAWAPI